MNQRHLVVQACFNDFMEVHLDNQYATVIGLLFLVVEVK